MSDPKYREYRAKLERPDYSFERELGDYERRLSTNQVYREMQINHQDKVA